MRVILLGLFLCRISTVFCQLYEQGYPKGYFRNPLNIPMSLSGNFGELRSNHYHMGLDIRTNKRENLPVYAAAEGYIARVKIEPGGFGRAIYINHPNGYTTLYAHLNNFNQKLEGFIKRRQYELESWSVFLDIPPGVFPVKKGEFIAYSGNTGGSQAPHLHFEIRRTSDDMNINPLLFGFPLKDNVKPRITRLAIYDRTKSTYEQSPKILPLKYVGDIYNTVTPVIKVPYDRVSFAITASDAYTGSSNPNGIFEASIKYDGADILYFKMDTISYTDTRYLNAHIDYKTRTLSRYYLQHLSELPGHLKSIYHRQHGDGVLLIDDREQDVTIIVKDVAGNTSTIKTKIRIVPSGTELREIPGKMFYPSMVDGYEADKCEFFLTEKVLYDSAHIRYFQSPRVLSNSVSDVHTIGASHIPLHESFTVRLLPDPGISAQQQQSIVMQWTSGSRKDVQKPVWQNGWASARFRDFGNFQLLIDEEPPQIIPVNFSQDANLSKASRIYFTVRDNLGKTKNVRAELNGEWLRFTNDKGRTFIYTFDEKCPRGSHELKIHAEDEAGNITEQTFRFTR